MSNVESTIAVENATSPRYVRRVDRAKYMAMRDALMAVLPTHAPGMPVREAKAALLQHLAPDLFPGGVKAGWWLKAVQLDLEAKGVIGREPGAPVRLFKLGEKLRRPSR